MKKYKIGFLCGFFDPLHDGHIDIMKQAKSMCDFLIVAVGTDEFMQKRKHHETVLSFEQRVEIVSSIRYVDQVVPEIDLDKIAAYNRYHFDVMFAGDDHLSEPVYLEAKKKLSELGVETIFIHREKNISSTDMRRKMAQITHQGITGDDK